VPCWHATFSRRPEQRGDKKVMTLVWRCGTGSGPQHTAGGQTKPTIGRLVDYNTYMVIEPYSSRRWGLGTCWCHWCTHCGMRADPRSASLRTDPIIIIIVHLWQFSGPFGTRINHGVCLAVLAWLAFCVMCASCGIWSKYYPELSGVCHKALCDQISMMRMSLPRRLCLIQEFLS
jgi:hypothetical protein